MTRAIRAKRDDGFTVVELVVAAAILFFAMTALVGLLGASTKMTTSAKSRSALTNSIASELDQIRTLTIDKVDYDSAGGSIPHVKTITLPDGVTVVLSYTITDRVKQNNTKEITIRGVATRPGAAPVRFSSFAVIRDRIGGRTRYANTNGPVIEFDDDSPPEASILEGSKVGGTSSGIVIKTRAWSETHNNVVRFEYTVDGIDTTTGSKASLPLKETNTVYPGHLSWFDVPVPSEDETWGFGWNSNQRDTANRPEVPDGIRTVTCVAYDDMDRASIAITRYFLVDNYAPTAAPPTALENVKNADRTQDLNLDWAEVLDGTQPADHYSYELYRKTTDSQTLTDWSPVSLSGGQTARALPLAYYAARVQAKSVLDKAGPWGVSTAVLTSPVLAGSHDVRRTRHNASQDNWAYTTRLTVNEPNVPSAVGSVIIERTGGGAGATQIDVTTAAKAAWSAGNSYAWSEVVSQRIKNTVNPTVPEYRLKVVLTPTGAASALTAYSQYMTGAIPALLNTDPAATNLPFEQRW